MSAQPTILIVDGEPLVRRVLIRLLNRLFPYYVVYSCATLTEALTYIAHHTVACIIVDYASCGEDTVDLDGFLHVVRLSAPVVLIAGLLTPRIEAHARTIGCAAVLSKPMTITMLRTTLTPLLV
jgi:DNA-binding NtrC family response regulator